MDHPVHASVCLQIHQVVDAQTANGETRFIRTCDNGRKLIQIMTVRHRQVHGPLRQNAHQCIGSLLSFSINWGNIQLDIFTDLPLSLQNIHSGRFHGNLSSGFRKSTLNRCQIHHGKARLIIVAHIHISVSHDTGNVCVAKLLILAKGSDCFFTDNIIVKNDKVQIAYLIVSIFQMI